MVVAALFIAGLHVPVIPLFDVVGRAIVPPEQIAATCVNSGATVLLFTVTVIVDVMAHWPVLGVKVYVVVAVLLRAGLHVPVMPLVDVDGNVKLPPEQMAGTCVNVGVIFPLTVTVIVVLMAH